MEEVHRGKILKARRGVLHVKGDQEMLLIVCTFAWCCHTCALHRRKFPLHFCTYIKKIIRVEIPTTKRQHKFQVTLGLKLKHLHTMMLFEVQTIMASLLKSNSLNCTWLCFSQSIRAICDEFSAQGLPNYPTGIPFIFWEQYIWLGEHLMVAVAIVLAASFVVMALILCNVWASMFVVSIKSFLFAIFVLAICLVGAEDAFLEKL